MRQKIKIGPTGTRIQALRRFVFAQFAEPTSQMSLLKSFCTCIISTTYLFSPCDFTRPLTEPLRREKVQVGNDQENVQS